MLVSEPFMRIPFMRLQPHTPNLKIPNPIPDLDSKFLALTTKLKILSPNH